MTVLEQTRPSVFDDAEVLYDRLPVAAHAAKLGGFTGGARFMAAALTDLGYTTAIPTMGMERLGFRKYGLASVAALLAAATTFVLAPWWLAVVAFVGVFYGVESRFVFAFPLAVTGCATPMRTSHHMAGSVASITPRVMMVAYHMLSGGVRGRGFVRSWCVGCLVIVLWFVAATRAARPTQ